MILLWIFRLLARSPSASGTATRLPRRSEVRGFASHPHGVVCPWSSVGLALDKCRIGARRTTGISPWTGVRGARRRGTRGRLRHNGSLPAPPRPVRRRRPPRPGGPALLALPARGARRRAVAHASRTRRPTAGPHRAAAACPADKVVRAREGSVVELRGHERPARRGADRRPGHLGARRAGPARRPALRRRSGRALPRDPARLRGARRDPGGRAAHDERDGARRDQPARRRWTGCARSRR